MNTLKFIYQFLDEVWDQTNYPADILKRERFDRRVNVYENDIQIELELENITPSIMGTTLDSTKKYIINTNIFLNINNKQYTNSENLDYLEEVRDELIDKLESLMDIEPEFTFKDDTVGNDPAGWTISEPGSTEISVYSELGEHSQIVKIEDSDVVQAVSMTDTFAAQTSGSVEFWIRSPTPSNRVNLLLQDSGGSTGPYFVFGTNIQYRDASNFHTIKAASNNTWYHILLDFDCATDIYDIYIDGTKEVDGASFYIVQTSIDTFNIFTEASSLEVYINNIDYSWSDGYFENRNKVNTGLDFNYNFLDYNLGQIRFLPEFSRKFQYLIPLEVIYYE